MNSSSILYEDNHMLVINKPAGINSQPNASISKELEGKVTDSSMYTHTYQYLQQRDQKKNVFLRLNHRLDKPVSGILVFSKTSKATARINDAFKNHRWIGKYYVAVVCGKLAIDTLIQTPLVPSSSDQSMVMESKLKNNNPRIGSSHFKTLGHFNDCNPRHPSKPLTLVKIQLITGIKHQIRSQLASLGHPIYNDYLYNAPYPIRAGDFPNEMIALHSQELTLSHPVKKEEILRISCPVPDQWKNYFRNCDLSSFT